VAPVNVKVGKPEQAAVDKEEQETVDEEEAEVDKDAGGEIFYVDLDANAGGDVTDNGFGHTVDADRLSSEGVLQQADGGSGECSGDGISAGDSEEDGDDEGKVKDGKTGEGSREKGLQQDCAKRHKHRYGGGKAMLFKLSAGCVAAGGHKTVRTVTDFVGRGFVLLSYVIATVEGLKALLNLVEAAVYGALRLSVVKLEAVEWLALRWYWLACSRRRRV
jgi:hypothetical protein